MNSGATTCQHNARGLKAVSYPRARIDSYTYDAKHYPLSRNAATCTYHANEQHTSRYKPDTRDGCTDAQEFVGIHPREATQDQNKEPR